MPTHDKCGCLLQIDILYLFPTGTSILGQVHLLWRHGEILKRVVDTVYEFPRLCFASATSHLASLGTCNFFLHYSINLCFTWRCYLILYLWLFQFQVYLIIEPNLPSLLFRQFCCVYHKKVSPPFYRLMRKRRCLDRNWCTERCMPYLSRYYTLDIPSNAAVYIHKFPEVDKK